MSVCMAHGWQLEAETGLQVSLCVFFVRVIVFFVPVLVGNDWQLKAEIGLQVCICVFFCVLVFLFGFLLYQCLKDIVGNWMRSLVLR